MDQPGLRTMTDEKAGEPNAQPFINGTDQGTDFYQVQDDSG